MRADRSEAMLDFLLHAASDEGAEAFPPVVLAGLRRVVPCEAVSYREWSPHDQLESSLAADEAEAIVPVWHVYPQVRRDDPLRGGAWDGGPLPDRERVGGFLRSPTSSATASSTAGDCTPRSASRSACGP